MTRIAVLGGGNGAHAAAADLTLRGYEVNLCEDERFASRMQAVFDTGTIELSGAAGQGTAKLALVTSDLAAALDGVRLVLVAVPAFAHGVYAEKLAEVVRPGQIVVVLPGTFGSLIFWKAFCDRGIEDVVVAETNTLPYATRLLGPGSSLVMSRFDPLKVGVMPASRTDEVMAALDGVFPGLEPVESVVACGLSSLNPLIHVPGCILNAGRIEYAKGDFHFYTEGFTSCVARLTDAVDAERIALLDAFGYASDIAAHGVGGAVRTDSIEEAIASDPNFAKIVGPDGLKNRYYSEDIPFGIASWAKLAHLVGVPTPVMDSLVTMGGVLLEQDCWESGHALADFGIDGMGLDELKRHLVEG